MGRMLKLRCVLLLLVLVFPAFAQKLSGRLGNPARPFTITAETPDEGSFELQRSLGGLTNWIAFTNYNTLPSTNTFGDVRTNKLSFYRLVRLEVPAAITSQPTGATNYVGQEIQLN